MTHVKGRKGDITAVAIEGAEAVATGVALSFANANNMLDVNAGSVPIPVDGVAGLLGLGACAFMPVPNLLHRTADRLITIASFRKGASMFGGSSVTGEIEEGLESSGIGADDALLKAAAAL